MNREQAKKYTSQPKATFTALQNMGYWAAVGYLEALEGPEVKKLVEFLKEYGSHKSAGCFEFRSGCVCGFEEALSHWKNGK